MNTKASTGKVKPDLATKNFVERDDVFRDFLILGYPKLKVEGLTPLPGRLHGPRERDVAKRGDVMMGGERVQHILSIECQTNVDYTMPIRMLFYEAEALMWEATANRDENKKEGKLAKGGEFLSGKKDGLVSPIVSLVAYWGIKPWDGKLRLQDVCKETNVGTGITLRDYGITLVDVMRLKKEEIDSLESNLREVALFLQCGNDLEKASKVIEENRARFKRMCLEGVEVLKALANKDINVIVNDKGEVDMTTVWDKLKESGIVEGRKEGIGIGESRKATEVILNLHKRNMPTSDIASVVARPESEVRSIINNRTQYAFVNA